MRGCLLFKHASLKDRVFQPARMRADKVSELSYRCQLVIPARFGYQVTIVDLLKISLDFSLTLVRKAYVTTSDVTNQISSPSCGSCAAMFFERPEPRIRRPRFVARSLRDV